MLVIGLVATLASVGVIAIAVELADVARAVAGGTLADAAAVDAIHLAIFHVALVGIGMSGVLAFVLTHIGAGLTEATRNLTRRVESIGQGAFGDRAPLEGPREVQRLAGAVNAMAESLAWREQRLLHAERLSSVGTLVAGVAHEIGNPLSWLRANADLALMDAEERLEDPALPGGEREILVATVEANRMNLDAVDRLAHITDALKTMSRAPGANRRAQDVNRLVEGCLVIAHPKIMHGVTIRQDLAATRAALGDGAELSQVVLNLVLNAADAVAAADGDAAGTITVATRDDGDAVIVEVADDGPGIPEEFRAQLFQPFATTKPFGTGLGLAISHRIVEAHGGSITATSDVGAGATFTVRLPAAEREA